MGRVRGMCFGDVAIVVASNRNENWETPRVRVPELAGNGPGTFHHYGNTKTIPSCHTISPKGEFECAEERHLES